MLLLLFWLAKQRCHKSQKAFDHDASVSILEIKKYKLSWGNWHANLSFELPQLWIVCANINSSRCLHCLWLSKRSEPSKIWRVRRRYYWPKAHHVGSYVTSIISLSLRCFLSAPVPSVDSKSPAIKQVRTPTFIQEFW